VPPSRGTAICRPCLDKQGARTGAVVASKLVVPDQLIAELEAAYDMDSGFIGQARARRYDASALDRFLKVLARCPDHTDGPMDGRLVRLLWWTPLILMWQIEGLAKEGQAVEEFQRALTSIENELIRILGPA
jgi:hypothetical protein